MATNLTEKDLNLIKGWRNERRNELRRFRRAAYHEVGHALAMYLCYGNIKRICYLTVEWDGSGLCHHGKPMEIEEYMCFVGIGGITGNLFKEVCYLIGGGLCEAMFCNKSAKAIILGGKYKFSIKGMEEDIERIERLLMFKGITNKKDVEAMIRLAVIRLKFVFWHNADKIKKCVNLLVAQEGFINRQDFYNIFRSK